MNDPLARPRVLLSVLKCAHFEGMETEGLFTAISAGYGRFECEKLLKPSGVELMNLPRTAHIELSVLRKNFSGQKELLLTGYVPISSVYPIDGATSTSATVWEGWLGLFDSDMSRSGLAPEQLFQQGLEMGSSASRCQRLLLRLQYLAPGQSAQQARPLGSAVTSVTPQSEAHPRPPMRSATWTVGLPTDREAIDRQKSYDELARNVDQSNQTSWLQERAAVDAALAEAERKLQAASASAAPVSRYSTALRNSALLTFEAALLQALDGGSAALESWLSEPSRVEARSELEVASPNCIAYCRRVASLRDAGPGQVNVTTAATEALYKPDKKDPIDCLLAAKLLRSAAFQQSGRGQNQDKPLFRRVTTGVYDFADRLRVGVRVDDSGRLIVVKSVLGNDAVTMDEEVDINMFLAAEGCISAH